MARRGGQPRAVVVDERLQAGFLNRRPAGIERLDCPVIHVDADHLVTAAGDGGRHAGPELAEAHD